MELSSLKVQKVQGKRSSHLNIRTEIEPYILYTNTMLLNIDLSKDMALILRIVLVLSTCLCNDITFRHPNPDHKPSETTVKHDSTITGFASRYVPATHKVSM